MLVFFPPRAVPSRLLLKTTTTTKPKSTTTINTSNLQTGTGGKAGSARSHSSLASRPSPQGHQPGPVTQAAGYSADPDNVTPPYCYGKHREGWDNSWLKWKYSYSFEQGLSLTVAHPFFFILQAPIEGNGGEQSTLSKGLSGELHQAACAQLESDRSYAGLKIIMHYNSNYIQHKSNK